MVKNLKSVAVLVAICTVVALLLAVTNQFTAPIIEKQQSEAANAALLEIMPNGTGFEEIADLAPTPCPPPSPRPTKRLPARVTSLS